MNQTQTAWVYAQLKRGKTLTAVQAYEGCGVMRLAAIIYALREKGHPILTTTQRNGKTSWASYRLARSKK